MLDSAIQPSTSMPQYTSKIIEKGLRFQQCLQKHYSQIQTVESTYEQMKG